MITVKKNFMEKTIFRYYLLASLTAIISLSCLLFLNSKASIPSHDSQGMVIPSLAPMLSRITDAVVNISTSSRIKPSRTYQRSDFFDQLFKQKEQQTKPRRRQQNLGSGVIINATS